MLPMLSHFLCGNVGALRWIGKLKRPKGYSIAQHSAGQRSVESSVSKRLENISDTQLK